MTYTPPAAILEAYADLLIAYALHGGEGVQAGEVVNVVVPECAKPFYVPLRDAVLRAGAHPIMQMLPDDVDSKGYFEKASKDQLLFFPEHYYRGLVDQCDHAVRILAEYDKHELEGVDPEKMMLRSRAMRPYMEWRQQKEIAGRFTWTLALYGTPAMAKEVGMSEEEYWEQIIAACYLDTADPKAVWRETNAKIEATRQALNALEIEKVHIEGDTIDLWVGIGPKRTWMGGSGRNIPSFELFTSPDWRQTEGKISFNQPLYYFGTVIEGISLTFQKGRVTEFTARKNESVLREMIAVENADKLGEFSLTDGRFSHITKVMGETLYDENMGGQEGNTHVALGNAYKDVYPGDASKLTPEDWQKLGYNESAVHTDIISTERRTVTAVLADGSERVIYKNGQFTI